MSSLNLKRVVSKIEQNGAFRYDSYFESVKQTKIGTKKTPNLGRDIHSSQAMYPLTLMIL